MLIPFFAFWLESRRKAALPAWDVSHSGRGGRELRLKKIKRKEVKGADRRPNT